MNFCETIGCQENELFTPAITSTATIGSQDIFELEIALGASITEIVGFVYENHIHVSHLTDVEIIDSEALLGDHIRRDGGTMEFVLPHRFQRCRTDHQRLLALVIGIIFQQFLANPCLPQTDGIRHDYTIILCQDTTGFTYRVFLKFSQING